MSKLSHIVYIANTRLPTEKAHGLATVKMCEAFAHNGIAVTLVVPRLWRKANGDPFLLYGAKKNFTIRTIPTLDLMPLGLYEPLSFLIQLVSFSILSALWVRFSFRDKKDAVVCVSHDHMPLYATSFLMPHMYYDVHHYPGRHFIYKRLLQRSFGFGVQTKWKARKLSEDFGIADKRIAYWPNGTDVQKFQIQTTRAQAREKLSLPTAEKIIVYTGHLFPWKGVDTLIRSVAFLEASMHIYIVGGDPRDIEGVRARLPEAKDPRVHFIGFVEHARIPLWLRAADVLVLPNTGKQKVSLYYTSPMKLFEYMASGTPVVASRIPSITEVIDETSAFLAEADNSSSFGSAIVRALSDPEEAKMRSGEALRRSRELTWDARATRLLAHMQSLLFHE